MFVLVCVHVYVSIMYVHICMGLDGYVCTCMHENGLKR